MTSENPHSTVAIAGHPLHPMLVPFPIACFVLTLVFDITYARTYEQQWANFSAWILTIGLIMAALAALAGVIDFFGDRRIRDLRAVWIHGIGNAVAVILSIWNVFVHSRDAYNSVVPTGITLSAIVVVILLVTGWMGWEMVYRHRVGVRAEVDR
ncbi:MAG TPA: DUF2231 domain-containing protein [Caulobacteraceae bacterium]|nr:DUF2231 domain-containing protein [Caulobacteraceae bacterium]